MNNTLIGVLKIFVALFITVISLMAVLAVLDVITMNQIMDSGAKVALVLGIIAVASILISLITTQKK